jgi:hypothetical protein
MAAHFYPITRDECVAGILGVKIEGVMPSARFVEDLGAG